MLRVTFQDYQALRAHGEETFPHECCGIFLGRAGDEGNEVQQVVRAGNTRTDSAHNRYHIAPEELIRAQREGRKSGLDIVGFYHSHPDHPAQPSATDLAEAHWIGCSYVITEIRAGRAAVTNSFVLAGGAEDSKQFQEEPIEIDVTGVEQSLASEIANESVEATEGEQV